MEHTARNDKARSNRNVILWAVSFAFAHMGLVWVIPYFPSQDGPSHIYNLVILRDLLNGGAEWGNFFTYKFNVFTNLGFHLISYPLLNFFSPFVVEKIFISIYIVLLTGSIMIFSFTFSDVYLPSSLLVFPLLFNFPFVMGFYSFSMAVPLFILSVCLFWRVRKRSVQYKIIVLGASGIILYVFHVIPFFLFVMSIIVIELTDSENVRKNAIFNSSLLILAPLLLMLSYYFISLGGSIPSEYFYSLFSFERYKLLMNEFLFFSTVNFSYWQYIPGISLILLLGFYIYQRSKKIFRGELRTRDIAQYEKTLIPLVMLFLLIYLLAPNGIAGHGSFFNERLPWIVLIMALPLLRFPEKSFFRKFEIFFVIFVVVISFVFNTVVLYGESGKVETFLRGKEANFREGAIVMTYKRSKTPSAEVDVLVHAISYYGIEKKLVNLGNFEAERKTFPTRYKGSFPPVPRVTQIEKSPETIQWSQYPSIRYVFGWEISDGDRENLKEYFKLIWQENQLSIWERAVAQF